MNFALSQSLLDLMYAFSQLFLLPVLVVILLLFFYVMYGLGKFLWQASQRWQKNERGFELHHLHASNPNLSMEALEAQAVTRLEAMRMISRIAPMLGLVATMIPMGPALKALGDGQLSDVSNGLMIAFSAVIVALVTASLSYWMATVRRRWYAQELMQLNTPNKLQENI